MRLQSSNFDVLRACLKSKGEKQPQMAAVKVPSHVPASWIEQGKIDMQAYVVNNVADVAAEISAEKRQPHNEIIREYKRWSWAGFALAMKIAAIEEWHWQKASTHVPKPEEIREEVACPQEAKEAIEEEQRAAGHWLIEENGWTKCLLCKKRA